jgi:outer membrane protein
MKKILVVGLTFLVLSCTQTKVNYVDYEILMKEYKATHALEESLKQKQDQKAKEFDSIQQPFNLKVQKYYQTAQNMSASKRQKMEEELQIEQQQLQLLQQQASQELQLENQKRSEALMKKIDSFVSDYAKTNKINMILGTQGRGAVLYADDNLNVTSEILTILNAEYDK